MVETGEIDLFALVAYVMQLVQIAYGERGRFDRNVYEIDLRMCMVQEI